MRFSVKSCLYSFGYRKHRERIKIIVDGVRPVFEVNRYFVLEQIGRGGQTSASIYHVCIYLNYLDSFGIDYIDVKLDDIQKFLNVLYTDGLSYAGKGKPCSITVIHDYIDAISKMYVAVGRIDGCFKWKTTKSSFVEKRRPFDWRLHAEKIICKG